MFEFRLRQELSTTEVRPLSKAPNPQLLQVCVLEYVKCRAHISLLVILCIIVYVTNKKIFFFFKYERYGTSSRLIYISTVTQYMLTYHPAAAYYDRMTCFWLLQLWLPQWWQHHARHKKLARGRVLSSTASCSVWVCVCVQRACQQQDTDSGLNPELFYTTSHLSKDLSAFPVHSPDFQPEWMMGITAGLDRRLLDVPQHVLSEPNDPPVTSQYIQLHCPFCRLN